MAFDIWTTDELMAVRTDTRMDQVPSFFLDNFFSQTYWAEDKEIKFADLPAATRYLAPFVLPTEQGRPLQSRRTESVQAFEPGYIKLKNAVRPVDARNLMPSDALRTRRAPLSLADKFELRTVQLMEDHLRAIRNREAWMAARAFIDGRVLVDYARDQGTAYPSVTLDFGRAANHTVALTTTYWNDPTYDILGDVETWSNRMYLANGGGAPNMMIVGARVAPLFVKNNGIKAAMDKNYRINDQNGLDFKSGLHRIERPYYFVGKLDSGMEVWAYKDTIDIPNGSGGATKLDILDERDVVLVAPGADGIRCFGAIYDVEALQDGVATSTDIYTKMWASKDPGEIFLMNQSAPLPIPLYPNRTLKARVLA